MSKKDSDFDDDCYARVNDGFMYRVVLDNGKVFRFADHDNLTSVLSRWVRAILSLETVIFSGAKLAAEDETGKVVIGKTEDAGAVIASKITSIAYWSAQDDEPSAEALEAATTLLSIQAQAAAEAIDDLAEDEDEDTADAEGDDEEFKTGAASTPPLVLTPAGEVVQFPSGGADEDEADVDEAEVESIDAIDGFKT